MLGEKLEPINSEPQISLTSDHTILLKHIVSLPTDVENVAILFK